MRLIDADALLRNTIYNPSHVPYIAESDIIFAPTIDAVEIVRCQYCEQWEYDPIFNDGWCRGRHQGDPNWFCADGKRNEVEADV